MLGIPLVVADKRRDAHRNLLGDFFVELVQAMQLPPLDIGAER